MICPHCSQPMVDATSYCSRCGTSLMDESTKIHHEIESTELPLFLSEVLVLRPRENIVRTWRGSREDALDDDEGGTVVQIPGFLIASDQRIFFVGEFGVFKKAYFLRDVIPSESVGIFSHRKGLVKNSLIIDQEMGQLRFCRLIEVDHAGDEKGRPVSPQGIQLLLTKLARERLCEIEEHRC